MGILTSTNLLIYLADLLCLVLESSVGTKDGPRGSQFLFSPAVSSLSSGCSLPGSFSPFSHPSPFISFPFHFLPSCSVFVFFVGPSPVLLLSFFPLSSFLHFLLFAPFLVILGFLVSCVLTTSPHFPSSDPSGPETPSSSAHRPLPPPKVLTPQHTALCAAVHTLGLRRGLIAKVCLSPWQCLIWRCGGKGWG